MGQKADNCRISEFKFNILYSLPQLKYSFSTKCYNLFDVFHMNFISMPYNLYQAHTRIKLHKFCLAQKDSTMKMYTPMSKMEFTSLFRYECRSLYSIFISTPKHVIFKNYLPLKYFISKAGVKISIITEISIVGNFFLNNDSAFLAFFFQVINSHRIIKQFLIDD